MVSWDHSNSKFATLISDNLGYNELDTTSRPYLQFRYPLIATSFYMLTVALFTPKENTAPVINKTLIKCVAFIHNVLLCLFSVVCFWKTVVPTFDLYYNNDMKYVQCGGWAKAYDGVFGDWMYYFLLSKVWEFADTWIVMAKGRRPLFLQVFHHIGIIFGMHFGIVTRCNVMWVLICWNSFVHSFMYAYYSISTLGYKVSKDKKKWITRLQLTQFYVGNLLGVIQIGLYYGCAPVIDTVCGIFNIGYTTCLIFLFSAFYKASYNQPKKTRQD